MYYGDGGKWVNILAAAVKLIHDLVASPIKGTEILVGAIGAYD